MNLKYFEFNWILDIWNLKFIIECKRIEHLISCDAVKDILQTVGSIAVQAMVFCDQEKLDNEAAGQTLPNQ